jgi:glycosyltransferase involved in cell wall biosynthesis
MLNSLVSVIIATRNEERNIKNCIKSILSQTEKNIEVIIVDNNSTDQTREIAKKYTDKVFNLRDEISSKKVKNFRGAQVNWGVEKSNGDIIFFPDADMTFDAQLLSECKNKLQIYDALYIPETVCGQGLFGKIRNFERSFYNMTCIDAIRVVKKSLFSRAGGFDVENIAFAPDDWDFTKTLKKMKFNLGLTENRLYHHEEWMTLRVYLKKKMNYAKTFDEYIYKWGKEDEDIKKQFGLWYRYLGVFVENGKVRRLLASPFLSIGMFFLRVAVGGTYYIQKKFREFFGQYKSLWD